jgi:hypothetical protein
LGGFVAQKYRYENTYIQTTGFSGNTIPTTNAGSVIGSAYNNKSEKFNTSVQSAVLIMIMPANIFSQLISAPMPHQFSALTKAGDISRHFLQAGDYLKRAS